MAFASGRALIIKKNTTAIAAVKQKSISINNEAVDVTNDDDAGWQTILSTPGKKSIEISVSGVAGDLTLRALAAAGTPLLTDLTVTYPEGAVISGDFYMGSYEESGETEGAVEFSATFQSSAAQTYTPAA